MGDFYQIKVLFWKRSVEFRKQPLESLGGVVASLILIAELYYFSSSSAVEGQGTSGNFEVLIFPIICTSMAQKAAGYIIQEKSNLLIESMRMMNLQLFSYWISSFAL
jgi:hypothetical protein